MLSKLFLRNKNWIFSGVLIVLIILLCYVCFTRQTVIETFTNNSNSISIDLYPKLDSSGDYNNIGSFRIIKATFLKGTTESGYSDISDPDAGYLDKIMMKRKIAIDAKDDIISRNKLTNFSKIDGNDESMDKLFLMSNDANAVQDTNVNPDGYYKFEIVGRKRKSPHDTLYFEYNIFMKKGDVNGVVIGLPESNDTISEITRNGDVYYHIKGYVKNGTDYLTFKATNTSKSFIVEVQLNDFGGYINYWDAYIYLRDYYTSENGRNINPLMQNSNSGVLKSTLLCDRHIQYNASFDIVPTKSNSFYKLKSSPDYTNNILFENINDSYGEGITEDENRVTYNPFKWGGIMYNQQKDPIGMSRVTWDRFAINRYDYDELQPGLMYREWKNNSTSHPTSLEEFKDMWRYKREWVSDELSRYKRVTPNLSNFRLKKDYYIADFRGYFRPDKTGYYRFGISCDDAGYIVKSWDNVVASWFGGHGSNGTVVLVELCMDIIT